MAEERTLGLARAPEVSQDNPSKEELQLRMEEARDSISQTVTEIKETVVHQYENVKDALDWREQYKKAIDFFALIRRPDGTVPLSGDSHSEPNFGVPAVFTGGSPDFGRPLVARRDWKPPRPSPTPNTNGQRSKLCSWKEQSAPFLSKPGASSTSAPTSASTRSTACAPVAVSCAISSDAMARFASTSPRMREPNCSSSNIAASFDQAR